MWNTETRPADFDSDKPGKEKYDMNVNPRKVAIVGCGFVGASIAFRFLQQGLFS